jgi:hypothetical protein
MFADREVAVQDNLKKERFANEM